ncbi:VOC family protein [Haliangium ochraceum]|uniref:Glyoxalase/bleomycin resistance protein/dioxygenase n=1 Tax=Haliangium ochraceum (strain DSM 14365 / JCM 11303 / SMP-2) TaxID=502025 RepID=D0LKF0_HALO1|nr:VOC family protein [Haliangium ochraceum]ACY14998.1 Glyoxalase/bleomycin resistance protein/dioxygenase [Haliangium ochraceum DSM 14365]
MISSLSHATIYVHDQDEAHDFYVNKLGFEVRTDITMDGFRWLTVGPKDQKNLEIVLMQLKPGPMHSEETVGLLTKLMEAGALGAGVFRTEDCQRTYEELKERGVEFMQPPAQRPYGIEAMFKDNSGNWFSLTQPQQ